MNVTQNLNLKVILLVLMAVMVAACGETTTTFGSGGGGGGGATSTPSTDGTVNGDDPVSGQIGNTLFLYNWTDYMNPDVLALFEAETGIRVIEDSFSSNEEALAKLQAGGTGYDLIFPTDYMIEIMIEEELLQKINTENIPNRVNVQGFIDDFYQGEPYYDPELEYCMPFMYGTTGIGISSQVENADEIDSWGYLFDPTMAAPFGGRISMLNDSREVIGAALKYLGYSFNSTDDSELAQARAVLLAQKDWVYAYDSDQFGSLLLAGDTLLAHGWNGSFSLAQEDDPDLMYVIPKEGGTFYLESMCVPVGAQNKAGAELFMDFILRGDVGALLVEYLYYGTPNSAAFEFLSDEILSDPFIFPPDDVLSSLEPTRNLGDYNRVYENIWSEVGSR